MLSFLLLWQWVAGALVHAHGSSQPWVAAEIDITAAPAVSQGEHCADSMMTPEPMVAAAATDGSVRVHAHAPSNDDSSAQQDSGECCRSAFCKCSCVQAAVLPVSMPRIAAVAAAPPAPVTAASLPYADVSGPFRPPI